MIKNSVNAVDFNCDVNRPLHSAGREVEWKQGETIYIQKLRSSVAIKCRGSSRFWLCRIHPMEGCP